MYASLPWVSQKNQALPSYGSGRYGFGVLGAQDSVPRDRCSVGTRHAFPSITFVSIYAVSWGGQSSVTRSGFPGPKPQIIGNENHHLSGSKKEPKPKLFGPDLFQWGRGLPRERVGAKKFDTSLETREIKLFGRDIPGFCRDVPGAPEKFEKKKFVFNFRSLTWHCSK